MAEELERIYTIPLKKDDYKSSKAAPTAVKRVKQYLKKHMKVEEKDIWIDDSLNNALWSRGKYKMYSKIRVKAVKFDDGVVEAYLPELDFKKSRRELLKEEKEKKTPILKKEEPAEGEGEDLAGAEDYDIAPTADGEVKIKKKKAKETKTEDKEKPKETKKETKKKEEKKPEEKAKDTKKKVSKKTDSKKTNKKTQTKKKEKTRKTSSKTKKEKKSE